MNLADPHRLVRVLYVSRSTLTGSDVGVEEEVERVLEQSRARNARAGLTGALMFTASTFIQALEGPAGAIEAAFERICCDVRHTDVQLIEFSDVERRAFGDWSMSRLPANGRIEALFAGLDGSEPKGRLSDAAADTLKLMVALLRKQSAAPASVAPASVAPASAAPDSATPAAATPAAAPIAAAPAAAVPVFAALTPAARRAPG